MMNGDSKAANGMSNHDPLNRLGSTDVQSYQIGEETPLDKNNSTDSSGDGLVQRRSTSDIIIAAPNSESDDEEDEEDDSESCNCTVCKTRCFKFWGDCCTVKTLKRRLPIINWLPKYRLSTLQADMIAGITVGLTVLPQGLAYAKVAGLPIQYGLYSAFMGCFVYCFMGTAKDVTLGPTAIMSLIVGMYGVKGDPAYAILLSLICGVVQLVMGFLRLGFLVNFISFPVINGFTSAAAVIIAVSQLKDIFGLSDISREFIHCLIDTFSQISKTNVWDMTMGITCLLVLEGLRLLKQVNFHTSPEPPNIAKRILINTIWLVGTARNAFVVLAAGAVAVVLMSCDIHVLTLTDGFNGTLPNFEFPKFHTTEHNTTVTTAEMFSHIGAGLAVVPLIGLLESIAIAKAFARKNSYRVDPTQELYALGVANIVSSFIQSYPVTGSFSRTAVNSQSGVRTPLGGVFTGCLVLLALGVLTQYFHWIPSSALGAVIIAAVIHNVDYAILPVLWKVKPIDLFPLFVTFFGCLLLSIEYGILLGIAASLFIILFPTAKPKVKFDDYGGNRVVMRISQGLTFPAVEHIQNKLSSRLGKQPVSYVIVDCSRLFHMDYSAILALIEVADELGIRDVMLAFAGLEKKIQKDLEKSDIPGFQCYATVEEALNKIGPGLNEDSMLIQPLPDTVSMPSCV